MSSAVQLYTFPLLCNKSFGRKKDIEHSFEGKNTCTHPKQLFTLFILWFVKPSSNAINILTDFAI